MSIERLVENIWIKMRLAHAHYLFPTQKSNEIPRDSV